MVTDSYPNRARVANIKLLRDDEPESEWTHPGYFRVGSYECPTAVRFVIDEPDQVKTSREEIVISLSLSIDGRKVLPGECELETTNDDETWYYARMYLKRPEWANEHGTFHVTVVQQLNMDGRIWTSEKDLDY